MTNNKTEFELAQEEKRKYQREYYQKNRKKLNEYARQWRAENPDKVAEANRRYWSKRAQNKQA